MKKRINFVFLVLLGVICVGLAEFGNWAEPNGWIAALGFLFFILVLWLLSIFDSVAQNVVQNQGRLYGLPVKQHAHVMGSGYLPMLLALGYGGVGLLLLIGKVRLSSSR